MTHNVARALAFACTLGGAGVVACASRDTTIVASDPHMVLGKVALPAHAVTLATVAPYDTTHLAVDARLADHTPAQEVSPVYSVSDSVALSVDATGLVTAHAATAGAIVRVTVTYHGRTLRDSARVHVTAGLPPALPVSLQLAPEPDSVQLLSSEAGQQQLSTHVRDASATDLSGMVIQYESSAPEVASIDSLGVVIGHTSGWVTFRASARAYGVELADSLRFGVREVQGFTYGLHPPHVQIGSDGTVDTIFSIGRDTARIMVGGWVTWYNDTPYLLDIVFDNPSAADSVTPFPYNLFGLPNTGSGNIAPFTLDTAGLKLLDPNDGTLNWFTLYINSSSKTRRFLQPGTYGFSSPLRHVRGAVVVCSGPCAPQPNP